ncbi:MAG: UvrD-helicase domain-containing protein [Erysipelotrichia bacterium]|nr:UvrD-helicase domain-containing protein [Erysipelotrichia bacterium]
MDEYLESLNKQQLQAVTTKSQYVRVIAGAGSGKTKVLTSRIIYLINNWGISPDNILAITFTNKAAGEMKKRIQQQLSIENYGVHVSTIHSFCVMVLRQEIKREGYPNNFTILDGDDQKSIVKEAFASLNVDIKNFNVNSVLDYISNYKAAGLGEQDALDKAYDTRYEILAKVYGYYLRRCHELYALDFDDLLLWTNKIFKKYSQIRKKWQDKYRFILVDEFQDIDNIQYELIELLTDENTYLYVVGDPDQTIYSWRGANINIIMEFEKHFKNTETIILNQNYRSTQNILNGANSLINYNKHRVKKELITENIQGNKIVHCSGATEDNEAMFVANRIFALIKKGYKYSDIAVLYRSNYLSRSIEKQLMIYNIPYIIYGGIRFYDRAEIKDMLSYLRMLTAKDDLSFKRTVNSPKRGIGKKSVDDLFSYARSKGISCFEAIDDFSGSSKSKLIKYKDLINDWVNRMEGKSLSEIFEMVYSESGLRVYLETSEDPADIDRQENIKELMNDIINYQNEHPTAGLDDYLADIALYSDIQNNDEGDHITLMTVHAAKGLEFKNVFVIGMSEGVFPSKKAVEENGIRGVEEERRLAYVAYTRAKENLFITDNRSYSYVLGNDKQTSRFVKEIDEQYVEEYGISEQASKHAASTIGFADTNNRKNTNTKYRIGEVMYHEVFGKGILLSIDNGYGEIAFDYPYMKKKVSLSFPKLHKWEDKKDE